MPLPSGSLHPVTLAIAGKGRLFDANWDGALTNRKDWLTSLCRGLGRRRSRNGTHPPSIDELINGRGEEPLDRYSYFPDQRSLRDRPSRSDRSAREAALPLTRAALLIVVLLSLGLWAAIWLIMVM